MNRTVFDLEIGDVVAVTYKGEPRNVQVVEAVTTPEKGDEFIKVLDLDKQGYRTFTAREVKVTGMVYLQEHINED